MHNNSLSLILLATLAGAAFPAFADDSDSKFSIHGFLTQAYADSDDHQIQGIPTGGTFDYRTAALQFRYAMSPNDELVVQLSHERLGDSAFDDFRDEVQLDWAFFQHEFKNETTIQVGRVPIPFGIYNKIKDVGAILPFYRPSISLYGEGSFSNETVDGLVLSHRFAAASDWSLATEAYFGEWEFFTATPGEAQIAKEALGTQLWLSTPIDGLRFGLGGLRYDVANPSGPDDTREQWLASVDASVGRLSVRAEYSDLDFAGGFYEVYYGHLGIRLTSKLTLNLQVESAELALTIPFVGAVNIALTEELAAGLNYAFRPDLLIKVEAHWNEGFTAEDLTIFEFLGPEPFATNFTIVSLSTNF